ncbi:hypothetical protein MYSTI_06607 [Myxococcus stipitatus DSM 14675]|uniref:DUF3396 domain-containing protein n=1 Tax=Myxococcus stipitatus (strain DSM 14675 / JCM 12634 / Mx s8) TaxID=1278073 RepID=L7UIZ2_MYXSD|nr:type VI immunity family protein [Myxococcus stipitatus]AGC47880.1 hypothetical protein MYSTI_06607 [Myxococcus stipitatus DSM 14675]
MAASLPPRLATPYLVDGRVAFKVMQDLTVYLGSPSEADLDALCNLYESFCPKERLVAYRTDELVTWSNLSSPELTLSGRRAASAGIPRPYLEPSRERIRQGRAFSVWFWDRKTLSDPDGSWSFRCTTLKQRPDTFHGFARFLMPLTTDDTLLWDMARSVANTVPFRSGHGGLVFEHDPWLKPLAFDKIYARARRFWAVDIDGMEATLPVTRNHIKGVNWLTLVGMPLAEEAAEGLARLSTAPRIRLLRQTHGFVIAAGPSPIPGDHHQRDAGLEPYFRIGSALTPLFPTEHPDFSGLRFKAPGATLGWVRRFVEPSGW